jgi:poly-gamma-glutamate synthesis protein (capsule biosynthesis protein)
VDDANLINTFSYDNLTGFYNDVERMLLSMEEDGADFTMFFMHWGQEYQLAPNTNQTAMAQMLCELGVDIIVGGHPHVIQPFTTLTSSTGNQTYCIYSVGNAVSNQRRETLETSPNKEYTEDGMIFKLFYLKKSDNPDSTDDTNTPETLDTISHYAPFALIALAGVITTVSLIKQSTKRN